MNNPIYDLAVIGGGITGLGVACEAASQGLKVALIEKDELAINTSANSLRIMHGGFRYLQTLNLPRTLYSLSAQRDLLRDFPDNIVELECLMPLKKTGLKSKYPATLGALLYSLILKLNGSRINSPKVISTEQAQRVVPVLEKQIAHGALCWSDAILNDHAVLVEKLKANFKDNKGVVVTNSSVVEVKKSQDYTITLSDGQELLSKSVVNAAARGAEKIKLADINLSPPKIFWARAFNLVIDKIPNVETAFTTNSAEGRLYFVVPGQKSSRIGTFYLPCNDMNAEQEVSLGELESVCADFHTSFPELDLKTDQIRRVELGYLPCLRPYEKEADLLSSELIFSEGRYFSIYSPKYTTFRKFAEKIITQVRSSL